MDPKTILFLLGAGIALFTFLFHTRRTTRRALRDDLLKLESERQRAVERLSEPPTARYARALGWGLGRLQRFYGPPFSSQALATPLLAAFCYSWAVFFTLAGFGFGDGTVMGAMCGKTCRGGSGGIGVGRSGIGSLFLGSSLP